MQNNRAGDDDDKDAQAEILHRLQVRQWRDARYVHWPELIGLVRQHLHSRTSFAGALTDALVERVIALASNHLKGLPEPARTEAVHQVVNTTVDEVLLSTPSDFAMNRFNLWLDYQCKQVARHMTRQAEDVRCTSGITDASADVLAARQARQLTNDQRDSAIDIQRALLALPHELWRPLLLKHAYGLPVESTDPGAETIAKVLNISPRTVRTRLRKAKKFLSENLKGAA